MKTLKNISLKTILIIFIFSSTLQAQVDIGVNFSKVYSQAKPHIRVFGDESGRYAYDFGFLSESTNKSFGISLYKSFSKLFATVNVNYRLTTSTYMIKDYLVEINPLPQYIETQYHMIHLPIIAGVNFGKLKVGVGTFLNYHVDRSNDMAKFPKFEQKNRKLDTGMLCMVGYKLLNKILITARYEKAFVNVGNNIYYQATSTRIKSTMDNFSIGIAVYPGSIN